MNYKDVLNDKQLEGVMTTEGPVLILAGAGSGKTRVLTHRVAYLIEEKGVYPDRIMAITFTNKAAKEMKERIEKMCPSTSRDIWVATFHSSCVRLLRRFGEHIGYDRNFTIYDTDDSKTVMKEVLKKLNIDTKKYKEKFFLSAISSAKNELVGPEEYSSKAFAPDEKMKAQVYMEYENRLKSNNAMDFDDLIMNTVSLLKEDREAAEFCRNKFWYVMVDEYQDTNTAQFELVRLLASGRENLCVVGDDDQSIYKFRGANIYNILNFEKHYPGAAVIRLEQNYRSTSNILDAANGVIQNNMGRKEKTLWTTAEEGEKLEFHRFPSAYEEAEFIASDIDRQVRNHAFSYGESAVLYRTNAQSRILEEKFLLENIPYKIVGGVNFYSRREIKDVLAYLKTIDNGRDDVAVKRIINVPKRSIGQTSIAKVEAYAENNDLSFYEAVCHADRIPDLKSAASKVLGFAEFIEDLKKKQETLSVPELIELVLEATGYVEDLRAQGTDEDLARIENIDELISKATLYVNDAENPTLSGFLEEVALVADIDNLPDNEEFVVLMTLHGAKGLEFPNVYMAGMEDGLFPSIMSIGAGDSSELEEERRLCYVGITRAMKRLTLTAAERRMTRGEVQYSKISRFVKEIPSELIKGDLWEEKSPFERSMEKNPYEYQQVQKRAKQEKRPTMAALYSAKEKAPKNFGTKIEKSPLDYGVGDRVSHMKFGEGDVVDIRDGGRDFEVTVEFDEAGRKKMFASFAKLKKI